MEFLKGMNKSYIAKGYTAKEEKMEELNDALCKIIYEAFARQISGANEDYKTVSVDYHNGTAVFQKKIS